MSAADDVIEMESLVSELAGKLTRSLKEKDRIIAVRGAFRDAKGNLLFGWNRTREFLRGDPRRIDSWEKDLVRNELRRLEERERQAEVNNLLANLNRTVAYLKTTDPDGYRDDVAAIERTLGLAGVVRSALAETPRGDGR